jgi:hypothetical protein
MRKPLTHKQKLNKNEYNKKWRKNNKEKTNEINRKSSKKHKKNKKLYNKKYYISNKEKRKKSRNLYIKKLKLNNSLYRLTVNIRSMVCNTIRRNGYKKTTKTYDIIGCSFIEFKQHIESKFESWMNWGNYGKYNGELNYGWDIDHIIPLSSAKTEEELLKLFNYTNQQPLCSKINRDVKKNFINYQQPYHLLSS